MPGRPAGPGVEAATQVVPRPRPPADDVPGTHRRGSGRPRRLPAPVLVAAILAGLGVYGWRGMSRLTDASLWAEDGLIFLKGAREDGLTAFLDPYAGYLHALPRLVALAFEPLPLTWQPGLYAGAGVVLGLACIAPALSARLGWLLSGWQRLTLFALLVVAPARAEVGANVANLIFLGAVALLLLGLSDDPRRAAGRWSETAVVGLLALSGPIGAVLLPVFAARAVRLRSRHSVGLLAVLAAATAVQWVILLTGSRMDTRAGSPATTLAYLRERLVASWLVGDTGFRDAWRDAGTLLAVGCIALAILLAVALTTIPHRLTAAALVLTTAAAVTLPGLTYARMALPGIAQRHLVLPLTAITLLVVTALAARPIVLRAAAAAALAASLIGITQDLRFRGYPERPIGPTATCLAEGRTPCPLPINPPGWRPPGWTDAEATLLR